MRATVTQIKRLAVHDGDGIRTTVFFKGCPLHCRWCHNPEALTGAPPLALHAHKCTGCGVCATLCAAHQVVGGKHTLDRTACRACGRCAEACPNEALRLWGREMSVGQVFEVLAADKPFYDASGGGITLSGGECLLYPDFCAALLRRCREAGIHTAVDTCGAVPRESLDAVIPYTDIFLYDIKAVDEATHRRLTGATNALILDNLRYLDSRGCPLEIRVPYVPSLNEGEMPAIAALVGALRHVTRTRILAYHDLAASKYEALGLPYPAAAAPLPTEEALAAARALFAQ